MTSQIRLVAFCGLMTVLHTHCGKASSSLTQASDPLLVDVGGLFNELTTAMAAPEFAPRFAQLGSLSAGDFLQQMAEAAAKSPGVEPNQMKAMLTNDQTLKSSLTLFNSKFGSVKAFLQTSGILGSKISKSDLDQAYTVGRKVLSGQAVTGTVDAAASAKALYIALTLSSALPTTSATKSLGLTSKGLGQEGSLNGRPAWLYYVNGVYGITYIDRDGKGRAGCGYNYYSDFSPLGLVDRTSSDYATCTDRLGHEMKASIATTRRPDGTTTAQSMFTNDGAADYKASY